MVKIKLFLWILWLEYCRSVYFRSLVSFVGNYPSHKAVRRITLSDVPLIFQTVANPVVVKPVVIDHVIDNLSVDELFDRLLDPHIIPTHFERYLDLLMKRNVTRQIIPPPVMQSIIVHLPLFHTVDPVIMILTWYTMGYLGITRQDFDTNTINIILKTAEDALINKKKTVFKVLTGLKQLKFLYSQLPVSLLKVIDDSLGQELRSNPYLDLAILDTMGYMFFPWSSFSTDIKTAFSLVFKKKLPTLCSEELGQILFALKKLNAFWSILEEELKRNLLNAVQCHLVTLKNDSLLMKYFNSLSTLQFQYATFSRASQDKLDEAFMLSFKQGNPYALQHLSLLGCSAQDFSSPLRLFCQHELPFILSQLSAEEFSIQFKKLSDLRVEWGSLTYRNQQLLAATILSHLSKFTSDSKHFVMQALVHMHPSYKQLPRELQQEIPQYLSTNLLKLTTIGLSKTTDSICRMELIYSQFPDYLKMALHQSLLMTFPQLNLIGQTIVLNSLIRMKVTTIDLSDEIQRVMCESLHKVKDQNFLLRPYQHTQLGSSIETLLSLKWSTVFTKN